MTTRHPGFSISGVAALRIAVAVGCLALMLGCSQPEEIVENLTGDGDAEATAMPLAPATVLTPVGAGGRNGIYDDRIVFGQSAAFSGPAAELGMGMRVGILTAFAEANEDDGVHGRELELISLDDAYEPEAAITNTTSLIDEGLIFALVGAVGTPTSRSAVPVAAANGTPYVAPFTGAEFLRSPEYDNILNLRASYYQETAEMVDRLLTDLGINRVAVMYQDDSFGRAGYQGVQIALRDRSLSPVSIGIYPRNTKAIKTALLDVQQGAPEAVIIIGAYEPVAHLISWARHLDFDPEFMTVSFVGSNALARELGDLGKGVYVTQVVPFPTDSSVPIVSDYLQALAKHYPNEDPGFVSLEGYIAGRFVIEIAERCGRDIDRTCFLETTRDGQIIDLGSFELQFGADDSQGSNEVFLTVIDEGGKYRPIDRLIERNE